MPGGILGDVLFNMASSVFGLVNRAGRPSPGSVLLASGLSALGYSIGVEARALLLVGERGGTHRVVERLGGFGECRQRAMPSRRRPAGTAAFMARVWNEAPGREAARPTRRRSRAALVPLRLPAGRVGAAGHRLRATMCAGSCLPVLSPRAHRRTHPQSSPCRRPSAPPLPRYAAAPPHGNEP